MLYFKDLTVKVFH